MFHVTIKLNSPTHQEAGLSEYMIIASHTFMVHQAELDTYAASNGTVYLFDTDEIILDDSGSISYIKMGVEPISSSVFDDEVCESIVKVL